MKIVFLLFISLFYSSDIQASVVPNYAQNKYQSSEMTRAEKKCIEEGYNITYAGCGKQTAPTERCPHHDNYYKSCSQEQWCRNNNYTFSASDCALPLYPVKKCDNGYELYRACRENVTKACEEAGYTSDQKCKLTSKRCPYSQSYGICCDTCPDFTHEMDKIPAGYVADGETCTTCDDIVKTNIKPDPCEGYVDCPYGPEQPTTDSCLQADKRLYRSCKTADTFCKEKGFTQTTCLATEDATPCPEDPDLKSCQTNCFKVALAENKDTDVIAKDVTNPEINLKNLQMRSLIGLSHKDCQNVERPVVSINLNSKNYEVYQHLFNRTVRDINFKINFEDPLPLNADGELSNIKIEFSGNLPDCPLQSKKTKILGTVNINQAPKLCLNLEIAENSKFISDGSLQGNVDMKDDAILGLKGDLNGYLRSGSYSQTLIKGKLSYKDEFNSKKDDMSIIFGCNSKNKIEDGIFADTSNILLRSWATLDTPQIHLTSVSDNPNLPNSLASIHLYQWSKLLSSYGSGNSMVIYPIAENDNSDKCEDKYLLHLGSAVNKNEQTIILEPANLLEEKWQCRRLNKKQLSCD